MKRGELNQVGGNVSLATTCAVVGGGVEMELRDFSNACFLAALCVIGDSSLSELRSIRRQLEVVVELVRADVSQGVTDESR